jgi:hypothetical protein
MDDSEGLDRLVRYPEIPRPDTAAPRPIVVAADAVLSLAFVTAQGKLALVRFQPLEAMRFGAPSDQGLDGHPLFSRGLEPNACFFVENSSWLLELAGINSVHPSHEPAYYADLRHFIVTFQGSTFECIARTADVEIRPNGPEKPWALLRDAVDPRIS